MMEIPAEALFQLSRDKDCVPGRLPLQASLPTFTMSHATSEEASGCLWLCMFHRRTVHPLTELWLIWEWNDGGLPVTLKSPLPPDRLEDKVRNEFIQESKDQHYNLLI